MKKSKIPPKKTAKDHLHGITVCDECAGIYEKGRKRGQVCEEDHYLYWSGWIVPVVCAVSILLFGYWWLCSQPPIEKPYPVYVTKWEDCRSMEEKWAKKFEECQADYRAQRETIRILSRKAKSE